MSVQPQPWPQPAPEIVAAIRSMYRGKRQRPLPVMVRDQLGEWLADEQFAGAYGVRGKPAGFQNSATGLDLGFYAARSYSLMRPPRTGRRLIRCRERSAAGWSGRGGRSWRLRWGRRPL